jgi:hypothetical protein
MHGILIHTGTGFLRVSKRFDQAEAYASYQGMA